MIAWVYSVMSILSQITSYELYCLQPSFFCTIFSFSRLFKVILCLFLSRLYSISSTTMPCLGIWSHNRDAFCFLSFTHVESPILSHFSLQSLNAFVTTHSLSYTQLKTSCFHPIICCGLSLH